VSRFIAFLAGILFGLAVLWMVQPVTARPDLPAPQLRFTPFPTSTATPEPTTGPAPTMKPALNPVTAVGQLGLTAQVQCWNCVPFTQTVKLSHYDPTLGADNCWDYDEDVNYCYSPTQPGIHWKGVWGFGAACPQSWPFGTWVVIEDVGSFVCLDRGGRITCDGGVCRVDVLTGQAAWWDQGEFEATIWVPMDPVRTDKK